MKRLLFGLISLFLPSLLLAQVEGYGKNTTGGAGFPTCTVTSAAESGTGTLNSCFQPGDAARDKTIVFAIGAASFPKGDRYVRGNLTIDGCANGQNGVTISMLANDRRALKIEGPVSNVILRCLRFEGSGLGPGLSTITDLVALDGESGLVKNVLVDRCTFTKATDGALDITGNVSDVTVQRSLFYDNPMAMLIKYNKRERITLHHNVLAENGERNPQAKGDISFLDMVSNIVYNMIITTHDGDSLSPYGTKFWGGAAASDSPGSPQANVRSSFYGGANSKIELQMENGTSPAGIYLAPDNVCSGCPSSPSATPIPIPVPFQVTATPVSGLKGFLLPTVGSPNRTAKDQAVIDRVSAALPPGPVPTPTPTPVPTPTPHPPGLYVCTEPTVVQTPLPDGTLKVVVTPSICGFVVK